MLLSRWSNLVRYSSRGLAGLCLSVAALTAHPTALAGEPAYKVTQVTPASATPHFPGFDAVTGNVLVSNVSVGTVTEINPGVGPMRTFQAQAGAHSVKVDSHARRAYVVDKGASTVSVLDLASGLTLATFPVGPNPHGLAIDTKRNRLYVTSIDANRLEVYDRKTYQLIALVPVGLGPWGVDARGDTVAVTDTGSNTIHIIDADDLEVEAVVVVGQYPWAASIGASGRIYVTVQGSGEMVAVYKRSVVWRTPIGVRPLGIVADESRNRVLASINGANQVAAVAARSGKLLQSIPVAAQPAGITYDFSTGTGYVANQGAGVVSTLSLQY